MDSEERERKGMERSDSRNERKEERREKREKDMNTCYKVRELFEPDFKLIVEKDIRAVRYIAYDLNLQGCEFQKHLQCGSCRGDEMLYFLDAIDMEIREHGIAIVFMTTFGVADADDVIYVVVDD